jgi:Avidin family
MNKFHLMDINGTWYNQLGSQMILTVTGKTINGTYHTRVGDASGMYELIGKVDTDNDESTAIGWVVLWNNQFGSSDSVTAWSGQIQVLSGIETIVTTWLLTAETDANDTWHSTLIGKDIFTRLMPSDEEKIQNLQKGVKPSNP